MESKSKKESLAVIIPMFNEEIVAEECIRKVVKALKNLPIPAKLIVVNDGSKDKTGVILKKYSQRYHKYLIPITHKKNQGYGGATKTGIETAIQHGFTWALHMDSDLTNDPKYISHFVKYVTSKYDCIKASRYVKGAKILDVPQYRRIISIVGNILAQFLFHIGIKDCTNGFRMVRVSKYLGITLKERNFSIILEELYYLKKKNAKFREIPYTITARKNSHSHFAYKPKIFYDYFKYAIRSFFVI